MYWNSHESQREMKSLKYIKCPVIYLWKHTTDMYSYEITLCLRIFSCEISCSKHNAQPFGLIITTNQKEGSFGQFSKEV